MRITVRGMKWNLIFYVFIAARLGAAQDISTSKGECVPPPNPKHGSYVTVNGPNASQGRNSALHINVTCNAGYQITGDSNVFCVAGWWSQEIPKCVSTCKLSKHESVDYYCLLSGINEGRRVCEENEPEGTIVIPECKRPNYYSPTVLPNMKCIDGSWNYVATCAADCGLVTPKGVPLIIGGRTAERGDVPWHAGIYSKLYEPYQYICGGTLVTNKLVLSAAHCFWSDSTMALYPASQYAVALGTLYMAWNNSRNFGAQKSEVHEIKVPSRFRGSATDYQDDIAAVILSQTIEYKVYIRPACISFNYEFEQHQLEPGNLGKIAGWGATSPDGQYSNVLKVVDLPYVDALECTEQVPSNFMSYITSDKFCAGNGNGTALCKGDSGGGLAFPEKEQGGVVRYYLRGVASTAPNDQHKCNVQGITVFTSVQLHEHFIRQNLSF